jgi:molybdenum cofactor cytidylyltransferase
MTFGTVAVRDAVGAVLAHTLRAGDRVLKKGRVLSAGDVDVLAAGGHTTIVCARIEPGELAEDAAALRVATALAGGHTRLERTHTGRTNVHAATDGVVVVEQAAIAAVNVVDEAITVATVRPFAPVRAGDMVATVKIIPFGAAETAVGAATEVIHNKITIKP